jgi:hypothetical protein
MHRLRGRQTSIDAPQEKREPCALELTHSQFILPNEGPVSAKQCWLRHPQVVQNGN